MPERFAKNTFYAIAIYCFRDVLLRNHETKAGIGEIAASRQHEKMLTGNLEASTLENRLEIRCV